DESEVFVVSPCLAESFCPDRRPLPPPGRGRRVPSRFSQAFAGRAGMYRALRELFDTGRRRRGARPRHHFPFRPNRAVKASSFSGGSTMSASLESAPLPAAEVGADDGLGELCVLMKLGEIVLKGSNRKLFERRLHNNIRNSVRDFGHIRLSQRGAGVIIVRKPGASDLEVAEIADR